MKDVSNYDGIKEAEIPEINFSLKVTAKDLNKNLKTEEAEKYLYDGYIRFQNTKFDFEYAKLELDLYEGNNYIQEIIKLKSRAYGDEEPETVLTVKIIGEKAKLEMKAKNGKVEQSIRDEDHAGEIYHAIWDSVFTDDRYRRDKED